MATVLETDDNGALVIPAELLHAGPHERYVVEEAGQSVVVKEQPDIDQLTPEQRVKEMFDWLDQFAHQEGPALSDYAVSRESIYGRSADTCVSMTSAWPR